MLALVRALHVAMLMLAHIHSRPAVPVVVPAARRLGLLSFLAEALNLAELAMAAALDLPVIPHGSSVFSCETPVRPCRSFAS